MRMLKDNNNPTAAAVDVSLALLLVTPASAAAAAGAGGVLQPPPAGGSDASFDADMVIILAAMLCVLVCAIGLDLLIRCFRLHCGRTLRRHVAAWHAAATMAAPADARPMKERKLMRSIPVVVYEAKAGVSAAEECVICLGELDDGEKVRVLTRCYPGFHVECIDMWLDTNPSCPTCWNSLL
ncbi:hypothetical protein PVAP13_3NG232042, partial [Panicum virgatum]